MARSLTRNDSVYFEMAPDTAADITTYYGSLAKRVGDQGWFSVWGDIVDATTEACALFLLDNLHRGIKQVTLMICSPGGNEDDARGLLGIMEYCKANGLVIRTYGIGMVGSAAFDIFIAGTRGYRFVHEIAMLMTHSSSADLRNKREIALQEYLDEFTLKTYTRIHSRTREKFLETGDWYIGVDDAIRYGIADAIVRCGDNLPNGPVDPKPRVTKTPDDPPEAEHVG